MDRGTDGCLGTRIGKMYFLKNYSQLTPLEFSRLLSFPDSAALRRQGHPSRHSDDPAPKRRFVRANLPSFLLSGPINSRNVTPRRRVGEKIFTSELSDQRNNHMYVFRGEMIFHFNPNRELHFPAILYVTYN